MLQQIDEKQHDFRDEQHEVHEQHIEIFKLCRIAKKQKQFENVKWKLSDQLQLHHNTPPNDAKGQSDAALRVLCVRCTFHPPYLLIWPPLSESPQTFPS